MTAHAAAEPYPPIGDYALIGDCHGAALVSRAGSIDWCCLPRMDDGSCFGRLLDWERGGYCIVSPAGAAADVSRSYIPGTMVLDTVFHTSSGEAHVIDCFPMHEGGSSHPYRQVLRTVEVTRGRVDVDVVVAPRFDYGGVRPWVRTHGAQLWSAMGGNDALVVSCDFALGVEALHDLRGHVTLHAGDRKHLSLTAYRPEAIDPDPPPQPDAEELDRRLQKTIRWWRTWIDQITFSGRHEARVRRSALVLKALINAPTGAIAAAPTTSLPEAIGCGRNWDYRYSWIRDSQFTVRSLGELGFDHENDGFRRFIERAAAGSPEDLQIVYGLDGRRRLTEATLPLEGYRRSTPVRIGNAAAGQCQLDVYGELLDLAWQSQQRGRSPDDDYWRFLVELLNAVMARWEQPDRGLWEIRGAPRHFVHSKVMCWAALDRGIRLAEAALRRAPLDRWRAGRDAIRASVEAHGVDDTGNTYVQSYGSSELDASLLLLPRVGYVAYDHPRMLATTDAVAAQLGDRGSLRRYRADDGLEGDEGVFVACTFWLAECLAGQRRLELAEDAFDRAEATANDLGLFAEEYDSDRHELLGNFPQGLSHLSHIAAAVAIDRARRARAQGGPSAVRGA